MPKGWAWDETLYLGGAEFYRRGRQPYAPGLAAALVEALALGSRDRLIDVGCGPGVIALALAPFVGEVVGVDPDPWMLAEAERHAATLGIANARCVRARAEELPLGLGRFRIATFAQSFHWMDRPRVAAIMRGMLEPDGTFVHISEVKQPVDQTGLPQPNPPYAAIRALIQRYLGPVPRAGQGFLRYGTPDGEALVLSAAGFAGPAYVRVPAAPLLVRSEDDLVAWVYSLAGSAPHLFADRRAAFEAELRRLLQATSPSGHFADRPPDTECFVWRNPPADAHSVVL